jgi:predicted RecA/RadA family phage recombinase
MTTRSSDIARPIELGTINEFPVIASDIIYEGSAVGDNGSGYARPLEAGDPFRGFAESKCDNSTGAQAAKKVRVRESGKIELTISGIAITDVGKPVYASDDDTFTLTQGSNSFVGYVYRYVKANTCIVVFGLSPGAYSVSGAGTALASGYILVGNASNVAAARAPSGDVTINNSGVTAIGNGKVTETMLESETLSALLSYADSFVTSHVTSSAH